HYSPLPSFPTRRSSDLFFITPPMTPRPKLKDLKIGTATILTILGFIFYMERFTLPNGYGTDMNPFFTYDHNIGIITISSNKLLRSEEHTSELQSRENLV